MRSLLPFLRLTLGLLVFGATGWQLKIHVESGFNAVNFFSYFTNLSNLLAASVLLIGAARSFGSRPPTPLWDQLRFMSVVNMLIVGVVFALLLRNVDLGSLLPWINVLLHYVMPVAVLVDWIVDPPATRLGRAQLLRVLIVPILYLAYVLLRGGVTGWYPYPFLNSANVGGYGGVSLYAFGIATVFGLAGWGLMKVGNRRFATS